MKPTETVKIKDRTPIVAAEALSPLIEVARRELHALEWAQRLALKAAGMSDENAYAWQQENVSKR